MDVSFTIMIIKHLNWKNPKHRHRDAPRAFAFRVGARSLAGAVVAVQAAREIARFAGVGRGPAF